KIIQPSNKQSTKVVAAAFAPKGDKVGMISSYQDAGEMKSSISIHELRARSLRRQDEFRDTMSGLGRLVFDDEGDVVAWQRCQQVDVWRLGKDWLHASATRRGDEFRFATGISCIKLSPDGRLLAVAGNSGEIWILETSTCIPRLWLRGDGRP